MHIKDRWKVWHHMASLGWKGLINNVLCVSNIKQHTSFQNFFRFIFRISHGNGYMPCFNFKFSAGNVHLCLPVNYKLSRPDLDTLCTGKSTRHTFCVLCQLCEWKEEADRHRMNRLTEWKSIKYLTFRGRASWYILKIKADKMHYFSTLPNKVDK
jgi:hypothetical protein